MRRGSSYALYGALALALGCGGFERSELERDAGTETPAPADAGYNGTPSRSLLVRTVLDGDTLIVQANAAVRGPDGQPLNGDKVRLVGVDAPEIAHGDDPAECWGDDAHAFTRQRVEGRIVTLEWDLTHCDPPGSVVGCRDDYDRLLAYVRVGDEVLNEALLSGGHARVFRGARFVHQDSAKYAALEREARSANRGLWSCP